MALGYTLIKQLSKAGVTEAWEAEGPHGKRCAIKIIPLEAAQETLAKLAQDKTGVHMYWEYKGKLLVLMDVPES